MSVLRSSGLPPHRQTSARLSRTSPTSSFLQPRTSRETSRRRRHLLAGCSLSVFIPAAPAIRPPAVSSPVSLVASTPVP